MFWNMFWNISARWRGTTVVCLKTGISSKNSKISKYYFSISHMYVICLSMVSVLQKSNQFLRSKICFRLICDGIKMVMVTSGSSGIHLLGQNCLFYNLNGFWINFDSYQYLLYSTSRLSPPLPCSILKLGRIVVKIFCT